MLSLPLFLLTACGVSKDRSRFEGKLENITNAEFYAYSEDGAFDGIDTIRIQDGEFVYERKVMEPMLVTLLYPNFTQTQVILEPGKKIKMKGDAAKIGEAVISGTEQNELLTEFRLANLSAPESNRHMAAAQFVRANANTLAAVAVYRKYFAAQQQPDIKTALQLLDVLVKAQPKSRSVKYLDSFYRPIFENGVGEKLPEFTAETMGGHKVSSSDFKGKRLVIACVGLWQSESMEFMRRLHKRLKNSQKKWECLVVSMDVDREVLRDRMQRDSLNYTVVCDRKAFQSPLVQKLGLHYVPSCMVIDANGKILQRDVMDVDALKIQ